MTMMSLAKTGMLAAVVVASLWGTKARGQSELKVKHLRCEYKEDPIGIDVKNPRLSWELASTERGVVQTTYEVRVTVSRREYMNRQLVWESGRVESDASNQVEYTGPKLESGRTYYWQVRAGDNHGHLSEWSETAKWEMGLLEASDWKAQWITPSLMEDETKSNPAPMLRREFSVNAKKKVERARLYATAMGLYEMELNGKRVGDQYFTPGWTAYDFRYQYQTYEVTGLVKSGENCLGRCWGMGGFAGGSGGTRREIVTGRNWRC